MYKRLTYVYTGTSEAILNEAEKSLSPMKDNRKRQMIYLLGNVIRRKGLQRLATSGKLRQRKKMKGSNTIRLEKKSRN